MDDERKENIKENTEKNEGSTGRGEERAILSYREALNIVKSKFQPLGVEDASLETSTGRVLAEDLRARVSVPPFDIALVDGYALAPLTPFDKSNYDESGDVKVSHYTWVNTGDGIPEGMDRVVKFEDAVEERDKLILKHKPRKWENIARKGDDIKEGDLLLKKGTIIDGVKIVSLKNCGIERLKVYKRPRVAVIATGDELAENNKEPKRIPASNDLMLSLFLDQWGCEVKTFPVIRDNKEEIKNTLLDLDPREIDLVLTTGGTSKGRRDFMRQAVKEIGRFYFHQTRIKPGRTAFFGEIHTNSKNSKKPIPIFCLPGNPPACLSAFMLYVRPAILEMIGTKERTFKTAISRDFPPSKSTRFILLNFDGEKAVPLKEGFFRSMLAVNSYLILEEGRDIKEGEAAEIYSLMNF